MKTEYVLGFLFDDSGDNLVLIRKNKPEWQSGLLNGVGGKIEYLETPYKAMVRECEEEAGVIVTNWIPFCTLEGHNFIVHCFKGFDTTACHFAKTMTDEEIVKVNPAEIANHKIVSNLQWLIRMALDWNNGNRFMSKVSY